MTFFLISVNLSLLTSYSTINASIYLSISLLCFVSTQMASVCWVYYFSKYIELSETLLFILRKKFNQISFLHVYHHTSMLFVWWCGVKYVAGGQSEWNAGCEARAWPTSMEGLLLPKLCTWQKSCHRKDQTLSKGIP